MDYEERVDNMLAKKIDASTKASVSKQELLTAQQQQLTAKAKGEQKLVEIEYQQKQEQTKQVVAAETKKQVALLNKQASELEAQRTIIEANANSERNAKLVRAGLTPQERAEWEFKTKVGVAAELSKIKLPETYIEGGSKGGSGSLLESLLGVKLLEK